MRIAIVSDIHGNLAALEAVEADIRRRSIDRVVNLGDSLSGPLLPLETAQFLMAQAWLTLAGNHDRYLLDQTAEDLSPPDAYAHSQIGANEFAWLASLPPTAYLNPDVFFCHATPQHNCTYLLETVLPSGAVRLANSAEIEHRLGQERTPFIACGHTHFPRSVLTQSGQLIVNPGSVGLPAYDDDTPFKHVIENGSPDARYAIVEEVSTGRVVSLVSVPYNYRAMAELARKRGFMDWEVAISTGYMKNGS